MSRIAKTCTVLAYISLALLPVSALASRWDLIHFRYGLLLFALAALIAFAVVIIAALTTRRQREQASRRALNQASLLSLPALTFFAFTLFSGGDAPMIHNVTTDPDDPPEFVAAETQRGPNANPLTYDETTARLQREAYPELQTLKTDLSVREAHQLALAICDKLGWEVYHQDAASGHIEAVATTRWFGFKDDIAIRINSNGDRRTIDLRSVSRVGKGDLGANARRISRFIQHFEAAE